MPSSHAPVEEITDPVSGFVYPWSWAAACRDDAGLDLVRRGLAVLTSSGIVLRRGFSTGTTAAACCKAAVLSLRGPLDEVEVPTPSGIRIRVGVTASGGVASSRKYPGDYPGDATGGALFVARCDPDETGVSLCPGEGIGRFTRDTPRYRKGDPAISPAALSSILASILEGLEESGLSGIRVHLAIPEGGTIAEGTLNPRIGVGGGISVLGTTGFVEPWDDHLACSVIERARCADRLVLTTGRTGLRYARLLFPDHDVVLAGAHLDAAIRAARGQVILCGLPALILKFLDPGILRGTGFATVEEFSTAPGFRDSMLAAFAEGKERYPGVRIVILDRNGTVRGDSG